MAELDGGDPVSERDLDFWAPCNVIAAFRQERDGTVAVSALTAAGVPRSAISVQRPEDGPNEEEVAELEAEMQDELDGSWGLAPGRQAQDAFAAAVTLGVLGLVVGAVAGLGWAYLFASGLSRLGRIVIAASVTGLAGTTIGLVEGGAGLAAWRNREPGGDGGLMAAERDVLIAVHLGDPLVAEQAAALLRRLRAEQVHLVDSHGIPLPPQAQHPRPADPEGWWWRHAGFG